jgi:hypothetical protein
MAALRKSAFATAPALSPTTSSFPFTDPRVSYWEPARWVATLRGLKTDSNVLLLKTDMGSGHFGPSSRYEGIKEMAFDYAFLLRTMNDQSALPVPPVVENLQKRPPAQLLNREP